MKAMKHLFKISRRALPALCALALCACSKDPKYEQFYDESGLYVALTGFNDNLYNFQLKPGESFTSIEDVSRIKTFVNDLRTADGTILYYAMEDAIDNLTLSRFPQDLKNVSIITFTDGLDQGSSAMNRKYNSAAAYLSALGSSLKKVRIGGQPISAYTIGLKGKDVQDHAQFRQNLTGLSSSAEYAFEVTDINEVSAKFQEVASALRNEYVTQTLTLTIPKPYRNTKIRFTFDGQDAASSACYIEGTYVSGALSNITYKGLACGSGSKVSESPSGSINVSFVFENVRFDRGFDPDGTEIRQWELIPGTDQWQINSEFNPANAIDKHVERQSAAIVLLLDCSSSLGSDFELLKQAADKFLDTLYNAYHS